MVNTPSEVEILKSKGWTRRFVACEPRLSEAVDMYHQSDFDVHLEPLNREMNCFGLEDGQNNKCLNCYKGYEEDYKIIFTRPAKISTPANKLS